MKTFEEWTDEAGIFKDEETREAWDASRKIAIAECIDILEKYQIPVGNSAAGEIACEWTYEALKDIREEIRGLINGQNNVHSCAYYYSRLIWIYDYSQSYSWNIVCYSNSVSRAISNRT